MHPQRNDILDCALGLGLVAQGLYLEADEEWGYLRDGERAGFLVFRFPLATTPVWEVKNRVMLYLLEWRR